MCVCVCAVSRRWPGPVDVDMLCDDGGTDPDFRQAACVELLRAMILFAVFVTLYAIMDRWLFARPSGPTHEDLVRQLQSESGVFTRTPHGFVPSR